MVDMLSLGWSTTLARTLAREYPGMLAGRISCEHRGAYRLLGDHCERAVQIDGKMWYAARSRIDFPAVGDWVAYTESDQSLATVHGVLPRMTSIIRKAAGSGIAEQLIATNVDVLFLMSSLDSDFNPRRIERYVTLAWDSATRPVILLNKADLCLDIKAKVDEIHAMGWQIPVHSISSHSHNALELLAPYLGPGRTVAILGSSGVGKSTLVNLLSKSTRQRTGTVRAGDDEGQHTTTTRELIPLPSGGVLIDTPGMRELQLWAGGNGLSKTFEDIEELAKACRFTDCAHGAERNCAVQEAVGKSLDAARLDGYRKLLRERLYLERKCNVGVQAAERERWKNVHVDQRRHAKAKRER